VRDLLLQLLWLLAFIILMVLTLPTEEEINGRIQRFNDRTYRVEDR
jgi:hypothetical protein